MNNKSRGELQIWPLFNSREIGVSVPEPHTRRAIQIFMDRGSDEGYTAVAARISEMKNGVLLFQMIDGEPASGAIYIYDRITGDFYGVGFDDRHEDDDLTLGEFDTLAREYGLLEFAARPELLTVRVDTIAYA